MYHRSPLTVQGRSPLLLHLPPLCHCHTHTCTHTSVHRHTHICLHSSILSSSPPPLSFPHVPSFIPLPSPSHSLTSLHASLPRSPSASHACHLSSLPLPSFYSLSPAIIYAPLSLHCSCLASSLFPTWPIFYLLPLFLPPSCPPPSLTHSLSASDLCSPSASLQDLLT